MRLWEIPVRRAPVEQLPGLTGSAATASACKTPGTQSAGLGRGVYAIVTELEGLLNALVRRRVAGVIDLRSLPMSDLDRSQLREVLGGGEVQASFHADGISRFSETGVAGIWWVEHRDRDGELIAELLEVAAVPEILCSAPDEIALASSVLQARMAAMSDLLPDHRVHELHR